MATKNQQEEDKAAFAEQFNKEDAKPTEQSEDEAFGLGPEAVDGAPEAIAGAAADAGATDGDAAATGAAEAAPAGDPKADALAEREAQLNAREQELDQRAASLQTSNTNEVQTTTGAGDDKPADGGEVAEGGGDADPRAALTEDFGPEFVTQLVALIKDVCKGHFDESVGGIQSQIQSVIDDLQTQHTINHFKAIAAVHEDFMDIVEGPEFADWRAGLPDAEKSDVERVVESGSSEELIAMLTKFKGTQAAGGGGGAGGGSDDEDALNNAEGVRSAGLQLPKEPPASNDYAAAWNEA